MKPFRCPAALCFFFGFVLVLSTTSFAQSGGPYKKKVVSFVDKVLVPGDVALTTEQAEYILQAVARSINFARFNYAALPDNVTSSFAEEASTLSRITPQLIKPVLDSTLAPQLLHILDVNKELLSKQNLSDEERNTFLATKAKAAGLTATELEAILNSGFFYIPYVDTYERRVEGGVREVKNDYGKVIRRIPLTVYTHSLQLGLLWYKLNVGQNNEPSVVFVGIAQGWKGEPIARSGAHEDETFDGRRIHDDGTEDFNAFKAAVDLSCFNIQTETKKLEAFRLTGEVTEPTLFGVRLNLGSKEGVGLDDAYWVEEDQETSSGDIVKTKRGFVKIREVGDNERDETATSYAQTITGTNYSEGLSVTELPLLGINGLVALRAFPVSISPFDNNATGFDLPRNDFSIKIRSQSRSAYGASVSIQTDLANATKITEFWAGLTGAIGITSVDGTLYYNDGNDSTDIGPSLTGYINLGVLKKFYFRRFGFLVEADVKYSLTRLDAYGYDGSIYRLTNGNIGLDGKTGIEAYITPILSLGVGAEYNIFGTSNSWSVDVTDKNNRDTRNSDATGPDVKYSGLGLAFWVNYSLPSLK
ncbi:MAG TPA: hypothetical protein VMM58_08025 [Bacteroidota bacterium]|nr:hypothetical protein [Bacteroidota bacterium]